MVFVEEEQEVKANFNEAGIEKEPEHLKTFKVSNVLRRCISFLFGQFEDKFYALRCTSNRELITAPTTTAIENYKSFEGSGGDAFLELDFGACASVIDIFVRDNDLRVKLKNFATGLYGDEFTIKSGEGYSFDYRARYISIKNVSAGLVSKYRINVWW